jgi:hypothetical protein
LEHFEIWKKDDINKLIFEIAAVYYNIIEIKKSIIQKQQNDIQSITKSTESTESTEASDEEYSDNYEEDVMEESHAVSDELP